jgi:hypothetical protein
MAALRRATRGDKDAAEGLRKAVVDFMIKKFVSNTEAGTSGVGTMKSDAFQTFVREHRGTLRAAGFSDEEFARMAEVADTLRKINRSIVAVKLPGGSNTTQDVLASMRGRARPLLEMLAIPFITEEGVRAFHGPAMGIATGVMAALVAQMRRVGVEKIDDMFREALLNPKLAGKYMAKVRPGAEANKAAKGLIAALAPSNIVQSVTAGRSGKASS